MTDDDKKKRKVSMSPAFLKEIEEKGHYGLFRSLVVEGWDESVGEVVRIVGDEPIGPLAVFREARRGERVDMRTVDTNGREMNLTCVWDNGTGEFKKEDR